MHRSRLTYLSFVAPETYLRPDPVIPSQPAHARRCNRDMDATAARASSLTPGHSLTSRDSSSTHADRALKPSGVSAAHPDRLTEDRFGAEAARTASQSSVKPGYDRRLASVRWHPMKSPVTRAVSRRVWTRSSKTRWLRSDGRTLRSTRDTSPSSSVSMFSMSPSSSSRSCQPSRLCATHRTEQASRVSGGGSSESKNSGDDDDGSLTRLTAGVLGRGRRSARFGRSLLLLSLFLLFLEHTAPCGDEKGVRWGGGGVSRSGFVGERALLRDRKTRSNNVENDDPFGGRARAHHLSPPLRTLASDAV